MAATNHDDSAERRPAREATPAVKKRGFFERFGLLFILIGIVLGVLVGVGYGRTMWLASGGPERKLVELREILRQKSQAEDEAFQAAALAGQAREIEGNLDRLQERFPEAERPPEIQARVDELRAEIDAVERDAAFHEASAAQLRLAADDEQRAKVERIRAEIARVEKLHETAAAMRKDESYVVPLTIYELIDFAGDLFLQVLKLLVIPLVLTSMLVGITSLGDIRKVGKMGAYSLIYYTITSSMAVALGLVLVVLIRPGEGGDDAFAYESAKIASVKDATPISTLLNVFRGAEGEAGSGMFPSNIFLAATETNVLALIVFAIVFGAALTTLGAVGVPVIAFFRGANEAVMKMVHLVMLFAPIGIFGLVAGNVAKNGGGAEFFGELTRLGWYVLVVVMGLLLHAVVLGALLAIVGRRNPFTYAINMSRALLTACTTASSSATLPITMECVEEKNGVSNKTASFVLPLGATVNMDGTALYEAVAAIFIAQSLGIDLTGAQLVIIFLTASLAAVGAAGIPEAGLVTLVMVLSAVGLPASGIGMILAVDWFLDRLRTTVNVFGDSIGAGVIDRFDLGSKEGPPVESADPPFAVAPSTPGA